MQACVCGHNRAKQRQRPDQRPTRGLLWRPTVTEKALARRLGHLRRRHASTAAVGRGAGAARRPGPPHGRRGCIQCCGARGGDAGVDGGSDAGSGGGGGEGREVRVVAAKLVDITSLAVVCTLAVARRAAAPSHRCTAAMSRRSVAARQEDTCPDTRQRPLLSSACSAATTPPAPPAAAHSSSRQREKSTESMEIEPKTPAPPLASSEALVSVMVVEIVGGARRTRAPSLTTMLHSAAPASPTAGRSSSEPTCDAGRKCQSSPLGVP